MTGRPPYDGETPVSVAIQHINGKATLPSVLNPNIPGGLEQIIMKAMAQDPAERYTTATAMLYDMDEFRKDPTILFDYNNPNAGMDDAALLASGTGGTTTEEKPPVKAGGEPPVRRTPPKKPTATPPSNDKKRRRRRDEIVEDEDRGGKVVTVVVILFALLTLVAIGLFVYTLVDNPGNITDNQDMITLPNLLNKPLEEAAASTDYVVTVDYYSYNDNVPEGSIISQNPVANTRIEPGSTVSVVVSAGPEPKEKVMRIEQGSPLDQAISYLVNTQGVDESLIFIIEEFSADVNKDCVIRTDPMRGETIPADEPIYLYVSKGPKAVYKTMVDLTSDFYNEESACKWLELNGFTNYEVIYVDSDKPEGKVISQSIRVGASVDVNAYIVLLVSGSEPPPPTTKPVISTEDPEGYVSQIVTIDLPSDKTEDYVISIYREDDTLVEERDVPAGTLSTQVSLTGIRTMRFRVQLSTGESWTVTVDFGEPPVVEDPPIVDDEDAEE
jgi:serine/threonine-protein kinase